MDGDNRSSSIRVFHEHVASSLSVNSKAYLLEDGDEIGTG
jgi:hypothetical protein